MTSRRLSALPGFSIDRVAAAAGDDPEVLRLENLDTDLAPPASAVAATRDAVGRDEHNSYLPFTGQQALRERIAERLHQRSGHRWAPEQVIVTCGATEGMLDALLAVTDPGDEVVLTDPTYAGMIYRVHLAGAVPRLVPFRERGSDVEQGSDVQGAWRLDLDALESAIGPRTRALFLMNPSMPSGAVLDDAEWAAVEDLCTRHDLWLIYDAAMEGILFDGRPLLHPASRPGLAERTLVCGSVSKEQRMIGWRVGWVAAPEALAADVARAHIYNVVTPPGISQAGAAVALAEPPEDLAAAVAEWQRRRDAVSEALRGYPMIPAAGGWSQLLDVGALGLDSFTASERLLARGKVAATPMRDWGEANGDRFVRLVFSNEPVERLEELGGRVRRALG